MFKDKEGRFLTQCLFAENYDCANPKYPAVFSLRDPDPAIKDQLPSFKRLFIESEDITGYTVAMEQLGSWEHMERLLSSKWFQSYWSRWCDEMEVRLKSKGLLKIKDTAEGDNASAYQAAKYLSDKGWEPKRGRPSKAELAKLTKKEKDLEDAVSDDMSRISSIVKLVQK